MALYPPRFPAVILNRSEKVSENGAANHVFLLFWNVPDGPERFKFPGQGADSGPSHGPSRISPTPQPVYKGASETGESVPLPMWTVGPSPLLYQPKDSTGKRALTEATLAPGTPPGVFPSYPCFGHC